MRRSVGLQAHVGGRRVAPWVHGIGVALLLAPLALGVRDTLLDRLGANPVEALSHLTGDWALRILLLCLAVAPVRRWLGWVRLAPCRRTLGLVAYAYAVCHVAVYLVFDLGLDLSALSDDVRLRPYLTAGFLAFVALTPLALTSTRGWRKRLGRRWIALHRLVYLAAGLALVHFAWQVKADIREPAGYAAVLALLLLARWPRRRGVLPSQPGSSPPTCG